MLGSRIICENNTSKIEGIIKYAEGHFIAVETQSDSIKVGETIQCMLYESNSVQAFQTTVVGKKDHLFIITIPPEIRESWMISRESLRFPVDIQGKISAVSFSGTKPLVELVDAYPIHIHDLSDGGIGFSSPNYVRESALAYMQFKLNHKEVFIEIEVVQSKYPVSDKKYYYGSRFVDTNSQGYQDIRAYTFQAQLKGIMNREK